MTQGSALLNKNENVTKGNALSDWEILDLCMAGCKRNLNQHQKNGRSQRVSSYTDLLKQSLIKQPEKRTLDTK